MRNVLHLLALFAAEVPKFEVVNKCPPAFVVTNKIAAPAVAARTFPRAVTYHAGHDCPTCGRSQFTIYSGSKGRSHSHRCPYDGTVWTH